MKISEFRNGIVPLLLAGAWPAGAGAQPVHIDIPFERFVLDNGLTVIVHEDRKAPIVAVNIWYHVGSKNEKEGKTGFAHLFEHLMFNGSEHYNDDYFKVLQKIGATMLNGTTNNDRTNYFQDVPTPALDTVLWMESDRMGYMLPAIDQARLDEQCGVVQNEKRQGENRPYGLVNELITQHTWPEGHPYSWTVIGSMEDLNAASLEDVREWFKTYYGPNNAVLVVAGDIDAATARKKVEHYFGEIPPGPPVRRPVRSIARMTGTKRAILEDRVPQQRLYKVWNVAPAFTPEMHHLDLISDLLGAGKTSRLYKRLVYTDQLSTDVLAYVRPMEIAGQFTIQADVRPGESLAAVEAAVDEELARFLKEGPAEEEVAGVRTRFVANFLRGIERIGGFGGKSDVLAQGEIYAGDPAAYKKQLAAVQSVTAADLRETARSWLGDGVFVLEVRPFPAYRTVAGAKADRSRVPEPGPPPELKLPRLQRAELSNGLKLVLAERRELPLVNMRLLVDAGYAADPPAAPGLATLTLDMLDEGTRTRSSLEIAGELDGLGMQLSAGSTLDVSYVTMSALKANIEKSLGLFADVVLNPAFPEADFKRLKAQQLTRIQHEKAQPLSMALRVLPGLLYDEGHAYGNPLTGSGTEKSVEAMTRDGLAEFHRAWFRPNNATLVVVGDITLAELTPKVEAAFLRWEKGPAPAKRISEVAHRESSRIYLLDRPGAAQSVIIAGHIAPPKVNPDEIAVETMNMVLGGQFAARINMNLREDKHWSYGARSVFQDARGQRPFFIYAPVQSDKTRESMVEIDRELRGILKDRPVTPEEFTFAQESMTLSLPGSRESMNQLAAGIQEIVSFGLPDDHFETFPGKVRALRREDVSAAAERVLRPDRMVWVVVGDREKIEQGIKELNFGPVSYLDADGNPLAQ